MNLFNNTDMGRSAKLSDCGKYRYLLTRCWRPDARQLGWIMLNPSTADALLDDPTIKKCMAFARAWDFGGIVVANLFHFRATDPEQLYPADLPEPDDAGFGHALLRHACGPSGDGFYGDVFDACAQVMVAWGSHFVAIHTARDLLIKNMAAERGRVLHCLAVNQDGQPRHPLYVRNDTKPIVWFDPMARGTA